MTLSTLVTLRYKPLRAFFSASKQPFSSSNFQLEIKWIIFVNNWIETTAESYINFWHTLICSSATNSMNRRIVASRVHRITCDNDGEFQEENILCGSLVTPLLLLWSGTTDTIHLSTNPEINGNSLLEYVYNTRWFLRSHRIQINHVIW
jgi:hypothetical protein